MDESGRGQMQPGASRYSKVLQGILKYFKVLQGVSDYVRPRQAMAEKAFVISVVLHASLMPFFSLSLN